MARRTLHLGAHLSIAGGLHLACARGQELGCEVIQIFTRNQQQWRTKPLSDDEVMTFKQACRRHRIRLAFAHDSYLVNLCAPDGDIRERSLSAFVEEMERCERLGLAFLVTHPGSPGVTGEREGIRAMIASLDEALKRTGGLRTRVLLETSAGQGACVGHRFEQMREMIEGVREPERLGVCFDTCHVFAAGYDLRTRAAYDATLDEFDRLIGVKRIEAFHVNDSKRELGSRVDRHEHIGKGHLGIEAFRCLMRDRRFARIPKVIETPKEDDMDARNLSLLRDLI
ncbi:MAG: deoxyribonuclease IV [Planctomycetes bacterium]|nr:deoxyribonuclease IV [Planctomycetota bacterium]